MKPTQEMIERFQETYRVAQGPLSALGAALEPYELAPFVLSDDEVRALANADSRLTSIRDMQLLAKAVRRATKTLAARPKVTHWLRHSSLTGCGLGRGDYSATSEWRDVTCVPCWVATYSGPAFSKEELAAWKRLDAFASDNHRGEPTLRAAIGRIAGESMPMSHEIVPSYETLVAKHAAAEKTLTAIADVLGYVNEAHDMDHAKLIAMASTAAHAERSAPAQGGHLRDAQERIAELEAQLAAQNARLAATESELASAHEAIVRQSKRADMAEAQFVAAQQKHKRELKETLNDASAAGKADKAEELAAQGEREGRAEWSEEDKIAAARAISSLVPSDGTESEEEFDHDVQKIANVALHAVKHRLAPAAPVEPLSDELRADAEHIIRWDRDNVRKRIATELLRRCPKPEPKRKSARELADELNGITSHTREWKERIDELVRRAEAGEVRRG